MNGALVSVSQARLRQKRKIKINAENKTVKTVAARPAMALAA